MVLSKINLRSIFNYYLNNILISITFEFWLKLNYSKWEKYLRLLTLFYQWNCSSWNFLIYNKKVLVSLFWFRSYASEIVTKTTFVFTLKYLVDLRNDGWMSCQRRKNISSYARLQFGMFRDRSLIKSIHAIYKLFFNRWF